MSFSSKAKNDLARILPERRCCQLAELSALIRMDGSIQISSRENIAIQLVSENAAVARKVIKLLKQLFDLSVDTSVRRKVRLKKNNIYVVKIPPQQGVQVILDALHIKIGEEGLTIDWNAVVPASQCCRRAYLRGAFLGGGSVSDPEGTYHLELITRDNYHAQLLCQMMRKLQLEPRVSQRKNWYVVYLKESEQIIRFLNIIGAHTALLDFENTRILKEMRNRVNRLVNCETANLNKTIDAGMRQVENIQFLLSRIGYEQLPASLKEVARLRLEFPDASLKELGELLEPPVSKSGVNHRLRRLEKMAEKLRG
ncbi:DNA-binding protein WhiA [Zhaonella formicivorans]|uniref:DNA-binding protein WhiA n=1 Tax=Zhaonella formicivorans TaxID=2528593 RepID=UPI0010E06B78|nr:DNA-binding protein WhiA [Zhaonella formicivorans]